MPSPSDRDGIYFEKLLALLPAAGDTPLIAFESSCLMISLAIASKASLIPVPAFADVS